MIQTIQTINTLRSLGVTIELHWIPTHINIDGNEWVDNEAKKVIGWREKEVHDKKTAGVNTNKTTQRSVIQTRIISTVKTVIRAYAMKQWVIE